MVDRGYWEVALVTPTGYTTVVGEYQTRDAAKRAASAAHRPECRVEVIGPKGSVISATQRCGRGMLWTD